MAGPNATKSIFLALGANFAIAVAKGVAAFITSSGSMLAEAIHSLADCGNQGLLLYGLKHSKKAPSPDHPLGYGRAIYFWSFIVALMLFSMGGLFSIYEGIHKLGSTEPLNKPWIAIGVLIFGIFVEGAALAGCIREVNKERGNRSLWTWFRESRRSELIVILGEDAAAICGLSFALVAVSLAMVTGNPIWDAIGSIGIGVLLVIVAFFIAKEVMALLIGQSAEPHIEKEIRDFIESQEDIEKVFNLLTMQLGNDIMVATKAQMKPLPSSDAVAEAINRCEAAMKEKFPQILWSFFEPDIRD